MAQRQSGTIVDRMKGKERMKENIKDSEKRMMRNVMACGLALAMAMLFIQVYLRPPVYQYVREHLVNSNIIPYAGMIVCFIGFYVLFQWILYKFWDRVRKIPSVIPALISWGLVLVQIILLVISYLHETQLFDAPDENILSYHMNETVTLIAMAGIFLMTIAVVERMQKISYSRKQSVCLYGFALLFGLIYCYALFTPNSFAAFYNVHHSNAYINSIYNTLCGAARSELNSSVYGYYGLLLAPIVKLLGGRLDDYYYAVCLVALFAHMCLAYSLFHLVRSNVVKCAGILALLLVPCAMQRGTYLQLIPHRTVFPCILIAWLVFCYTHKKFSWLYQLIGYVICGLALIWNFEIGIVCLIGYVAFFLIESLKDYSLKQKGFYFSMLWRMGCAVLTVLGTLCILNLINLLMGGGFIGFKALIFPMMNKQYFSYLLTDYQTGVVAWLFVASLALILIGNGLGRTKLSPAGAARASAKSSILLVIGVLALGQMVYYINRSAYGNLNIVFFLAILMLCILTDYCLVSYVNRRYKTACMKNLFRGFSYVFLTVLFLIGLGGVYNYANMQNYRTDNQYRDRSVVDEIEHQLRDYCEPDTRALGMVIPALYSDLKWDCGYHLIDAADYGVYPSVYEYLDKELNENIDVPILIETLTMEKMQKAFSLEGFLARYEPEKSFVFYENELVYWVPKK